METTHLLASQKSPSSDKEPLVELRYGEDVDRLAMTTAVFSVVDILERLCDQRGAVLYYLHDEVEGVDRHRFHLS